MTLYTEQELVAEINRLEKEVNGFIQLANKAGLSIDIGTFTLPPIIHEQDLPPNAFLSLRVTKVLK